MIKKISIDDLSIGMYICDLNNQWVPRQNASRRGLIKYQSTIDKVRALGVKELYIDTDKGADCESAAIADPVKQLQANQFNSLVAQSGAQPGLRTALSEERENAEKQHKKAKTLIGGILDDIKAGKGVDADAVEETADDIISSLNTNENALACLSHIRSKDKYLLEHSVNVGVLLGIFARARRFDEQTTRQLVAGGLLHDIGKILVPDEILNKPGKLEPKEWEEMKRHVTYGERILDVTAGLSDITRSICGLHHERLDGSGYPRNLPAEQITVYGRMSAICDVYDAITADRVYHEGMSPNEAMKKLIEWSIFHLDKELVYDFIRCLSVYPVGTLVELSNGTAAVIIEANRRQPKLPVVRAFYSTRMQELIPPEDLDLANRGTRTQITNTLDARQLGIDIRPFL
ncbi:HD-GYP domain-containing protein [Reinekea marinisedimentorum]|uniref:HD-GYP domain-containing protein (C-di-GMP phosphodiesterase class II) n=1 Tax=Reinekea marinisedimentorum TaxID=230495 RepID=A0A4R3IDT5_9GAMM|nr:HD-GYP domain-containing protein [Reinekea marinisedimentorum]TCS43907.1 HD-GYP domain-containing protein (c-di-GMP phosphodiesterase class II) [Reinekea marinisedimentorum]